MQSHLTVQGTEVFLLRSLIVSLMTISLLTTGGSLYLMMKLNLFPGPALISFDESGQLVFRDTVNLDRIHLTQNTISGVQSISEDVDFETPTSRLSVSHDHVEIASPKGFQVVSENGDKIFPANLSSISLPSSLSSLYVADVAKDVKKIRSPVASDLEVKASTMKIRGNEGLHAEGKTASLTAANIVLTSVNGSIVLAAHHEGIFMHGLNGDDTQVTTSDGDLQYKLCVCGKSGRLFRLHLSTPDTTCADVRFPESANPCL